MNLDDIRIKAVHDTNVMVTYVDCSINLIGLSKEIRDIFKFDDQSIFTMKFIDDEGDPCMISSQNELEEAIRLYELNKDSEITLHVFSNAPYAAGLPCPGEDKNIYRRGARRWRKLYRVNGHIFQPKRYNPLAVCSFCGDRIWGLGRQGFKCINCKLMIHKKCHKLIKISCAPNQEQGSSGSGSSTPNHLLPNGTINEITSSNLHRMATPARKKGSLVSPNSEFLSSKDHHFNADPFNNILGDQSVDFAGEVSRSCGQYQLEDFDLKKVIGRGSYAKVLLVELKKTKRPYAMKVIKKELVTDDEDIDWVQTEKHVFEIATGCEFLVGLHSCFQTQSKLFFVIEFVSGGDLMFHMQRQRRLPEEHARFYAAEISLALNYLHEKGIIYRDLKLDNVLLDKHGHIKLTDYGMCKEGIRPGDTTTTFCGTPNYIAPEILKGYEYSFSVDWWALGVLLYEMLSGRSPFDIVTCAPDNPDENREDYLFQVILEKTIRIPRSISVKAQSVLKGFLDKNSETRLGCNPTSGFTDIKEHAFFRQIDWDALKEKKVSPPYVPKIENDPLEHFDPGFTTEPVQLTPPDMKIIETIDQSEFEGFEFINPEIMTVEDAV